MSDTDDIVVVVSHPTPSELIEDNISEVKRILAIHEELTGKGPGYRANVEVLNRSAIVLLVACWEAFVEDLAGLAFELLFTGAKKPQVFPKKVLVKASNVLRSSADEGEVWKLAGDGWKKVLEKHKNEVIASCCGKMNSPRATQVDMLFESLLGIKKISSNWHWPGSSVKDSITNLEELVNLRGAIAHRAKAGTSVYKKTVRRYMNLIYWISMKTSNTVVWHLHEKLDRWPWPIYKMGPRKPRVQNQSASNSEATEASVEKT